MSTQHPTELQGHLVICGLGHVGYRIAELLHRLGQPFTVITRDIRPEWRAWIETAAACFIEGDARSPSCLHAAGISSARAVLIVTDDDLANIEIALDIQKLSSSIPLIVRVFDRFLADRAQRQMHVRSVLSPALLTAPVFVAAAQGQEMVRAFDIDTCRLNVLHLRFQEKTPGLGRIVEEFCAQHGLRLLSLCHPCPEKRDASEQHLAAPVVALPLSAEKSEPPVLLDSRNVRLAAGDSLLVMASEQATGRLRQEGFLPRKAEAPLQHPEAWHRASSFLAHPFQLFLMLRKAWNQTPNVLRGAFLALHLLLILSVIIFHYAMPGGLSWTNSFYFVVAMMTTVGFGDFNLQNAPDWLKIYGCGVMAAGAALVAIFFGIITDYIVTQRVEQALGRRKTTLRDHIVVIGLGDVGTRIVEELHRIGERVVAIERDPDHESIPGLQDSIHIIIGDANRESAMQQANITQARAAIVTTTDDLVSLRIAHQAETLNPQLRSVIRIYDSTLANKLGIGLGIDRAVNAAATAAATFVACALQTCVEQGFTLDNRLLALRWLSCHEVQEKGLTGKNVAEAQQEGVMVLARRSPDEHAPTTIVTSAHTIGSAEDLLLLEEYLPDRHAFAAPRPLLQESPLL